MALLTLVPVNTVKVYLLLALIVVPILGKIKTSESNRVSEPILPPPLPVLYDYSYQVKSKKHKNDYGHSEKRVGDVVTGSYRVLLPNGRTQVVNYYVDPKSGYVAKVTYE